MLIGLLFHRDSLFLKFRTAFTQIAGVSSPFMVIGRKIEDFVLELSSKNIQKGREIMQDSINLVQRTTFSHLSVDEM